MSTTDADAFVMWGVQGVADEDKPTPRMEKAEEHYPPYLPYVSADPRNREYEILLAEIRLTGRRVFWVDCTFLSMVTRRLHERHAQCDSDRITEVLPRDVDEGCRCI